MEVSLKKKGNCYKLKRRELCFLLWRINFTPKRKKIPYILVNFFNLFITVFRKSGCCG